MDLPEFHSRLECKDKKVFSDISYLRKEVDQQIAIDKVRLRDTERIMAEIQSKIDHLQSVKDNLNSFPRLSIIERGHVDNYSSQIDHQKDMLKSAVELRDKITKSMEDQIAYFYGLEEFLN